MMEFHVSREVRDRYQFAETLFSFNGNVVFANLAACREFAHRINQVREADKHPERRMHPGALYAMGVIDEASHVVMAQYRQQLDPTVMTDALGWLASRFGEEPLDRMLLAFVEQFPGSSVYRGEQTVEQWLTGSTNGDDHRAVVLEELILLWMANRNQAFQPFAELFDDRELTQETIYRQVAQALPEFFATRPLIPVDDAQPMHLFDLLLAPALTAPGSLRDQLAVIAQKWRRLLGAMLDRFLLIAGEILREEELAIWTQFHPAFGPGTEHRWGGLEGRSEVPSFSARDFEYERYSEDVEWMPRTVLMAKSTYVWLAQLSRQYGREIHRLDQIPDQELDLLARRGFNALWLIGLWERSRASKTIKQICGNRDAVASAYSLYDYRVADDLGGDYAYQQLRHRAAQRGIRLASDMVANHMGIDSPWVVEHPEWFLSRWDNPYPNYSFDGPDLSSDGRVEVQIERHYYDQSDAAVVFRRRDRASGEVRYVYHGNDGTSFPWNDTAQLDYLNPAVREQVIQTILHVARLFPIIRFDAAMTLAKRHFHRLWFPGPGSSGAIPSRAEYGMTDEEFNRAMPHEFWREVVDRVATEVPGTLLLAEAFWLMEGYFVRTLGMHRVYNSAFMNMLRDEDNAKYRSVIKNTIEFDPDILKRYVNFMSNPDERTAIDQFGSGDKCFGVATLMATLPGLPMFGHGQIEGFTEKYGMEYRWPRYEENPNAWLVERHERQIAPLLHRRALFAESSNFLLYDFYNDDGTVNEDVYAYSNRSGEERALVIYHNRYADAQGTIHNSAAYADKGSGQLRRQSLREGLQLNGDPEVLMGYRDAASGLEFLRRGNELAERGFRFHLHAYEYHAFLDWRELRATEEKPWDRLCDLLQGQGVPNLDEALLNLELRPAHDALRRVLEPAAVRRFTDVAASLTVARPKAIAESETAKELTELWERVRGFLEEAQTAYQEQLAKSPAPRPTLRKRKDAAQMEAEFRELFGAALQLPSAETLFPKVWPGAARHVLPGQSPEVMVTALWGPVMGWGLMTLLADSLGPVTRDGLSADLHHDLRPDLRLDLLERLRLREPLANAFASLGLEGEESWRAVSRLRAALLTVDRERASAEKTGGAAKKKAEVHRAGLSSELWADSETQWLLGRNEWQGHTYIAKEPYEQLLWWLQLPRLLRLDAKSAAEISAAMETECAAMAELGYRVDSLLVPEGAETAVSSKAVSSKAAVAAKKAPAKKPAAKKGETGQAEGAKKAAKSSAKKKAAKHKPAKPKKST